MEHPDPVPDISVVVPTFERPARLRACLDALAAQELPRDRFEVIVVDDGGRGALESVVASFGERMTVALVDRLHAGPAATRNAGAALARGRLLAFTDDDCAPEPGWLPALLDAFAAAPEEALGGRTRNGLPRNLWSTASQSLLDYLYAYYNRPASSGFFASNNLAVAADAFRALGGFDERFPRAGGEDRDFCDRCRFAGRTLRYVPEAVVVHCHDLTFAGFVRQHFSYGRGARRFHDMRALRTRQGLRLEPASFYVNLPRQAFAQASGLRAVGLVALLALSQAANVAGFLREPRYRGE